MQYTCKYLSPLGEMLLASDGEALTGAWFEGQKYYAAALAVAHEEKSLPVFEETRTWLDGYFNGRKPVFMLPLHLHTGKKMPASFRLCPIVSEIVIQSSLMMNILNLYRFCLGELWNLCLLFVMVNGSLAPILLTGSAFLRRLII